MLFIGRLLHVGLEDVFYITRQDNTDQASGSNPLTGVVVDILVVCGFWRIDAVLEMFQFLSRLLMSFSITKSTICRRIMAKKMLVEHICKGLY